MFASINNVGFKMIDRAERVRFIDTYDMTPEEFMKRYEEDYSTNLDGKYVVAVEGNCEEPDVENGVYSHKILSIYKTRDGQSATLSYHGHISFINVDMGEAKNNKTQEALKVLLVTFDVNTLAESKQARFNPNDFELDFSELLEEVKRQDEKLMELLQ